MDIKRGALLLGLSSCLGTALAMAVSGQDEISPDVVAAVEKDDKLIGAGLDSARVGRDDVRYDLTTIKRAMPENIQPDGLFGSKSWYVPPPLSVSASNSPPPQPSAPPLAFVFLGRMIDKGEVTVFLSKSGQQYTVKVNDILDDTYRVDMITADNAVLTYIPLNIQQTLVFNSTAIGSSAMSDVMSREASYSLRAAP